MSFENTLQTLVREGIGILGAALMETDGIPIEQVWIEASDLEDPLEGDLTAAGAEFGRILSEVAKASDSIGGGGVSEIVIGLARVTLIFSRVEDEIVLVVAVAPTGNLGKARYLIRRSLMAIRQEL